jgi:RNA polymerase sigma-70 factor (ECF subfamily)
VPESTPITITLISDPAPRSTPATPAPPAPPVTREELLRHLDAGYNLARWLCRNEQDAQDVVQESYLRALRFSEQCRPGMSRAWLLKIVRNTCHTWRERNGGGGGPGGFSAKATHVEMSDEAAVDQASPEILFQRGEDISAVRRAIDALPDEFREAIVLREIEGLAYKEIAQIMSIPVGTVMSRLSRARERLKELLIQCGSVDAEVGR